MPSNWAYGVYIWGIYMGYMNQMPSLNMPLMKFETAYFCPERKKLSWKGIGARRQNYSLLIYDKIFCPRLLSVMPQEQNFLFGRDFAPDTNILLSHP